MILILKQFSISIYIDIELDIENGLNQILILILRLISISIYIDIDIEPQNPILPNSAPDLPRRQFISKLSMRAFLQPKIIILAFTFNSEV